MKPKYLLHFSLVCGFSFSSLTSCKDKAEPSADTSSLKVETAEETPANKPAVVAEVEKKAKEIIPAIPVKPAAPATPPAAVKPKVSNKEAELGYVRAASEKKEASVEQLADNMGFAQYLPSDSEMYVSYVGVGSMLSKLRETEMGKFIEAQMKKEDEDLDEALKDEGIDEMMAVAGEEVFFAAGNGSSSMLNGLLQAGLEVNKFQYDMMFKMMLSQLDPGLFDMNDMNNPGAMVPDFLKKKDGAIKLLRGLEMAPMYVGFKVSDKVSRDKFIADISASFNEMINQSDMRMMKVAESKEAGGFYGFEWSGAGFLQMMQDEERNPEEGIAQMIGQALLDDYKHEISKKKLTCMVGNVGDYVVIYVGKDAKSVKFEKSATTSLLSNPEMSFAKKHAGQEIASLMYFSESSMKTMKSLGGTMKLYADTFSNVLEKTEAFGDTRRLRDLLKNLGEKEDALYAMIPAQRVGVVAAYDQGLKIDMYSGKEYPTLDLESPRALAKMVNHPDAAIYGSWIIADDYSDASMEYLEAIFETAYEGARVASEVQHEEEDWVEFQNNFKMFDKHFAADLHRVWKSLRGNFAAGVGSEFAMMMDLKGTMPRVPKVPSVILENGEIPRITFVKPVVDREKIALAWDEINVTSVDIAKTLEQVIGQKMEMLKPERAKRFGLDTWSYQLGVTSKDANLAVALNDDYWFMTTSPTGLEDLTARAYSKNSKQAQPGAEMVIRLDPVRVATRKWLKVIEEHGSDISEDFDLESFEEAKPLVLEFLKASEELELIDLYTRKEDGEVQSTIHFKMR